MPGFLKLPLVPTDLPKYLNINIEKADIVIETTDYEAECGDQIFN